MASFEHPSAPAPSAWPARRAAFMLGVRAFAPASLAIGVWGLVTGVAMVKSGLTDTLALGMNFLAYAGSAQLTSLPLIVAGAPLWLIFAAAFVVNLRFVIFAAAMHPYFRHHSWFRRTLFGYFSGDVSFVLFMSRYADAPLKGTREQSWFFVGTATGNLLLWHIGSVAGILLGAFVPAAWSLEFGAVLALLAIVVPLANSRPVFAAIGAAAVVAWMGQLLPLRLGLVCAVLAGVAAGIMVEKRIERRRGALPHGRAGAR